MGGDFISIIIHLMVMIFGFFGIGIGIAVLNFLLLIASIAYVCVVAYSLGEIIIKVIRINRQSKIPT